MSEERVCGFCGNQTTVNWVHGHGECSICHSNIDECCSGECVQEVTVDEAYNFWQRMMEDSTGKNERRLAEKDLQDEFSKMPDVQDDKSDRQG